MYLTKEKKSSPDTATVKKSPPQHPAGDISKPYNAWIKSFDLKAFTKEIDELGERLQAEQGEGEMLFGSLCVRSLRIVIIFIDRGSIAI
jgi:hypothetical protein